MRMPTAVVRHKVPWRRGDPECCPLNHGSLSPQGEALPAVPPAPPPPRHGPRSPDPRAPSASRDEEMAGVAAKRSAATPLSLSAPPATASRERAGVGERAGGGERAGVGGRAGVGERAGKRFPILGPTRQDTELYFRRRRSARHRIRTTSRPLVTRSADRVVPADYGPSRLPCTIALTPSLSASTPTIRASSSTTTHNHHPPHHHHFRGFRYVDTNPNPSPCHNGLDAWQDPEATTTVITSLPAFNHVARTPQRGAKPPASAMPRSGSSPSGIRTSLPSFDRSASFHAGSVTAGSAPGFRNGGSAGKKHEIPIKFLSESSRIRTSELTHRVSKSSGEAPRTAGQAPRTLQPSKYGFHRRSKSPTFKRLVEVAEKLQNVLLLVPDDGDDLDLCDGSRARVTSPVDFFPAVAGAGVGEGRVGGGGGGTEEDGCGSEEEVRVIPPHEVPVSLPHSLPKHSAKAGAKGRPCHSVQSSAKRPSLTTSSSRKDNSAHGTHYVAVSTDTDFLANGWGAWEVVDSGASEGGGGGGMDLPSPTIPSLLQGLPPFSDSHTELHLFLPRLADTASEESGSGAASKASPDRHRRRLPNTPRATHPSRGKTSTSSCSKNHPPTSLRPPQHPHTAATTTTGGGATVGERSGRPQSRRFGSPVRVLRRDRTPKRRAGAGSVSPGEVCESYEPFIRGEHLKEKLEDFPTLISLDQG